MKCVFLVIYYKLPDEDLMNASIEAKKSKGLYLYCIYTHFSQFLPLAFAINEIIRIKDWNEWKLNIFKQ